MNPIYFRRLNHWEIKWCSEVLLALFVFHWFSLLTIASLFSVNRKEDNYVLLPTDMFPFLACGPGGVKVRVQREDMPAGPSFLTCQLLYQFLLALFFQWCSFIALSFFSDLKSPGDAAEVTASPWQQRCKNSTIDYKPRVCLVTAQYRLC